jgi:hypothetical protein
VILVPAQSRNALDAVGQIAAELAKDPAQTAAEQHFGFVPAEADLRRVGATQIARRPTN